MAEVYRTSRDSMHRNHPSRPERVASDRGVRVGLQQPGQVYGAAGRLMTSPCPARTSVVGASLDGRAATARELGDQRERDRHQGDDPDGGVAERVVAVVT